jgi:alcohol dehydrogenase
MRAAIYREFQGPIAVETVDDPACPADGVILAVRANGVCRSDWHGWMGHDADIRLPHVPGHEMAGEVLEVGPDCRGDWRPGHRVAVPFILACGHCPSCRAGHQEVCERQDQPGFTLWGSFAEYVAIPRADINLVALPESLGYAAAASLGCRFTTAFRAVLQHGDLRPGQWLAVHACGGVGLSAVMIGRAAGARVVAVDRDARALTAAAALGAEVVLNAAENPDIPEAIRDATGGGAHVSVDALGHRQTCRNSILCLRRRGRHVQVGLLAGDHADPPLPLDRAIAYELSLHGSHGMAAHRYNDLMRLIADGSLQPERLIARRVDLPEGAAILSSMVDTADSGIAVIDRF